MERQVETLLKQILTIMLTSDTDMLDIGMVSYMADKNNFEELYLFIDEYAQSYINFIVTGNKKLLECNLFEIL